jgi:hypothetical protein
LPEQQRELQEGVFFLKKKTSFFVFDSKFHEYRASSLYLKFRHIIPIESLKTMQQIEKNGEVKEKTEEQHVGSF